MGVSVRQTVQPWDGALRPLEQVFAQGPCTAAGPCASRQRLAATSAPVLSPCWRRPPSHIHAEAPRQLPQCFPHILEHRECRAWGPSRQLEVTTLRTSTHSTSSSSSSSLLSSEFSCFLLFCTALAAAALLGRANGAACLTGAFRLVSSSESSMLTSSSEPSELASELAGESSDSDSDLASLQATCPWHDTKNTVNLL